MSGEAAVTRIKIDSLEFTKRRKLPLFIIKIFLIRCAIG